jgi:protein TonB
MNKLFVFAFLIGFSSSCSAQVKQPSNKEHCSREYDNLHKKWIYLSTTKAPEFPGGNGKMAQFISKNLQYPDQDHFKGSVRVSFIVESDGSLTNGQVQDKDSGDEIDKEVLRIIGLMPKWNPGECKGKKVPARVSLPIMF